MNQFYELRKVKDAEYYNPEEYCKQSIIDFELESLEIALTAKYWFDEVANGESVTFNCEVIKLTEKYDRNGKLMAFANVVADEGYPLELVVFAATYSRTVNYFDKVDYKTITVSGKKDGKKVLVNKVREAR
jgi:hypothetical protein